MQFHILSFEGPDAYARAGGIASRITGLAEALATAELETHLWFVGDPALMGHEERAGVQLHRWCQWLSRHHPRGVYEAEDNKAREYASSLPPYLLRTSLGMALSRGDRAVVLAEEWHTIDAVLHLDALLRSAKRRDQVTIFWNANNTFGFERVDWKRLAQAATITTVSRYMKQILRQYGVDAVVIPNGLEPSAFDPSNEEARSALRDATANRPLLTKVARFDPDKRWLATIEIMSELKKEGRRPLLVARGGIEAHGQEVLKAATAAGLRVVDRTIAKKGPAGLVDAVTDVASADIVNIVSAIDPEARKVLFAEADCVLANSGHEPFGLVGLEAMAASGLACTGCSGEDYAIAGRNALVLQTANPREFVSHFARLRDAPHAATEMRRAGRATAETYAWPEIIARNIFPQLDILQGFP
jgi:glycosyltransferase involved in cell wall biosynthesis